MFYCFGRLNLDSQQQEGAACHHSLPQLRQQQRLPSLGQTTKHNALAAHTLAADTLLAATVPLTHWAGRGPVPR